MPEINDQFIIQKDSLTAIADGVRWRTGRTDKMDIDSMIAEMKRKYYVDRQQDIQTYQPEAPWVRPEEWPDLDSLNLEMTGDDFIYMTYDANQSGSAIAWHIETANRLPATLEVGHIENGIYVADETYTVNHNTNFVRWTDDLSGYLVIRITGQISRCYSYLVTKDGQTQHFRQQPIVERIAWVPHLTAFCLTYSSNAWTPYSLEREKVANGEGTALTSLYYAWNCGYNLRDLDISGLRTPNVTNFSYAFSGCYKLTELDLRHFGVSKATGFNSLFSDCRAIQRIDLSGWQTGNVTSFSNMFDSCMSLTEINGLSGFDTGKAVTIASMFANCYCLRDVSPAENFSVGNVTNFSGVFNGCRSICSLDLSKWDTSKSTTFASIFNDCGNLKELNIEGWSHGVLTSVASMFSGCRCLQKIDVSWIHLTSACTSIYSMFSSCWSVQELVIPEDWDLSGLSSANNTVAYVFNNCYSLKRISGIANWKFSLTNSLTSMFFSCWSLEELDVSGWKTDTVTSLSSIFQQCYSLKSVDLTNWEIDNCTNISSLFSGCQSLKSYGNIDHWDTSKVTTMANMFSDCYCITSIPDIKRWDMTKVTSTASMFSSCLNLTELEITDLNLPECTTIASMFSGCRNLKKVKFTGWNVPKLSVAPSAFLGNYCYSLREVEMFPIPLNHSYAYDYSLTHESLVNILNSLPTVTASRTLNLVTQNINRLTAEEKQIATSKGWTLAN